MRPYVKIFIAHNGLGPWLCADCGEPVLRMGRSREDGSVHHEDEDPENNAPENLRIKHKRCHARAHMLGIPKGENMRELTRQRMSAPKSDETKAKIAASVKLAWAEGRCKGRWA